ncbi:gp2 [Streptococcus sp. HSISB1]|nr:gp2 [Streptococcus sp. HSISB1]
MKIGFRKPSLKKSLKSRTTAKWKRQAKKAIIPGYGKKGSGWIKNPKKGSLQ